MGLQRINWSQIDTANVPNGFTVDIGTHDKPINKIYADNLYFTGTSIGDLFINNGTFNNGTITLTSNSGNTITISGISSFDTYVTGATFENNQLTLLRNDGISIRVNINNFTGLTVNGSISGTTFYGDGAHLTGIPKVTITGGTYEQNTGITTFTNSTGGTFTVSGYFKPQDDIYVTGTTFENNLFTISRNDGQSISTVIDNFTGLTVNGTISGTTFYGDGAYLTGIPKVTITGGTYDQNTGITTFTNSTGGTFTVSGYFKPQDDIYVTGTTFENNQLTLNRSDGQSVSTVIDNFTGLTVNGTISGTTFYGDGSYLSGITDTYTISGTSKSDGFILSNNNNTNISVTGLSTSILYNTTLSSGLTSNGVGGISGGTTVGQLYGKSIINVLDNLLFPTVTPTLNGPTYSITSGLSSLLEILSGTTIFTPSISGTFNRGSIVLNGVTQNFRSGPATGYTFSGFGIPSPINQTGSTYNYVITGQTGLMSFNSTVYYSQGPQPYDNKGNPYSTPLAAGSINASQISVEGVYPLYATVSSITAKDKQQLYSMLTANNLQGTLAAESNGNKQTFWIPTAWTRPLTSINYFNTVSNSFDTTNKISDFTQTTAVINGINYKQYTNNTANRGSLLIKLIF